METERTDPAMPPDALLGVSVRASVELGRARMPLNRALALADGAIVDLDRTAEAPVDLYVNGRRYATGRLVIVEDEWALRIERVLADAAPPASSGGTGVRQVSSRPSEL